METKLKITAIVFVDINGVITVYWVPQGQTVNRDQYSQVLALSQKNAARIVEKRFIDRDNALATTGLIEQFLAENRTLFDPWLFPKLKSALKETRFELVVAVKKKNRQKFLYYK